MTDSDMKAAAAMAAYDYDPGELASKLVEVERELEAEKRQKEIHIADAGALKDDLIKAENQRRELQLENARLRAALEPFARAAEGLSPYAWPDGALLPQQFYVAQARHAKAATRCDRAGKDLTEWVSRLETTYRSLVEAVSSMELHRQTCAYGRSHYEFGTRGMVQAADERCGSCSCCRTISALRLAKVALGLDP